MQNAATTSSAPRLPTTQERRELSAFLQAGGHDQESADLLVETCYVSVFDNYATDGPGYCGRLMSVVWSGAPSFYEVFVWEQGQMHRVGHEWDEKECDRCGRKNGSYCWSCWRNHAQGELT